MIENRKMIVLGGLIVGVPVLVVVIFAAVFFNSGMATADSSEHVKLLKLENQTRQLNATVNDILVFLKNQQIPLDRELLNLNLTHSKLP